jgi:hypothetical protein
MLIPQQRQAFFVGRNVMSTPIQLYHYTTINTLALILKSQSINFGRLDKVNDKREGSSTDFGSFAQYIFTTCWTETAEENLALWNMYTPKMRGVRIELPLPMFEVHKISDKYESIIPETETVNKEKGIFIIPHVGLLYKMQYTDDESLLNPAIIVNTGEYMGFSLNKLGVYKKTIWRIEDEWRFRLNIVPIDKGDKAFPASFYDLVEIRTPPPISNYLIKIKDTSFQQMKIRLGPKLEPGDYEIVSSLVNTFNSAAIIEPSSLSDEVR